MYCLQWLIPVLLIPKPINPAMVHTHVMFMVLYLIGFFLERKPCTICSLVFLVTLLLICYSGIVVFIIGYMTIRDLYKVKLWPANV